MASLSHTRGHKAGAAARGGYTLMELSIALSISAVMILAVLSCYSYLTRGVLRAGYAGQMESASRRTLTTFGQDVASASMVTTASSTQCVLTTPSATVTYTYSAAAGTLTRQAGSAAAITMLSGISTFSFGYYNAPSTTTTSASSVKLVSVAFTTVAGNQSSGNKASLPVQSAMVVLRNKAYLQ